MSDIENDAGANSDSESSRDEEYDRPMAKSKKSPLRADEVDLENEDSESEEEEHDEDSESDDEEEDFMNMEDEVRPKKSDKRKKRKNKGDFDLDDEEEEEHDEDEESDRSEMGNFENEEEADEEEDEEDDQYEEDENYLQKFDESLRQNVISNYHPEMQSHNYEEVEALSRVVKNEKGIIVDPLHKTLPFLTKYEKAKVLGERAKQINAGAKPFVDVENNVINGYLIALKELEERKIPFVIKRPLPNGGCEYWKLKDLELLI